MILPSPAHISTTTLHATSFGISAIFGDLRRFNREKAAYSRSPKTRNASELLLVGFQWQLPFQHPTCFRFFENFGLAILNSHRRHDKNNAGWLVVSQCCKSLQPKFEPSQSYLCTPPRSSWFFGHHLLGCCRCFFGALESSGASLQWVANEADFLQHPARSILNPSIPSMFSLPRKKSKGLKRTQNHSQNHGPITPRPSNAYSYNGTNNCLFDRLEPTHGPFPAVDFWLLPLPARLAKQHWIRALIFSEASPRQ